jgi:hypothetical protein
MLDAVLIFKDGAFISSYELLRQELSCFLGSRRMTPFIHHPTDYARDVQSDNSPGRFELIQDTSIAAAITFSVTQTASKLGKQFREVA